MLQFLGRWWCTTQYKWVALSNTTVGVLMGSLDMNIVLIALPSIAGQLAGTTPLDVLWILLGYQVVVACVLVNFGRLSDMFGRVKLYKIGFALFTLGSGLCSIAQTPLELIAFRVVQALGAGFLFSNSAAIVTDAFPPQERGKALGINQVSIVVGSVLGLVLGGALTQIIGWRAIFWVNLPIGVFATLWAHFRLKELAQSSGSRRVDIYGNICLALGLLSLLLAITLYAIEGLPLPITASLLALSAILFYFFIRVEIRTQDPMFDLSLFRNRIFSVGNQTIFLNALSRGSFILVMVFYLQGPLMGLTPLQAGLFLIPLSLSISVFGPISGSLSDRLGQRRFVILGLSVTATGFLLMMNLGQHVTFESLSPALVLIGSGMGIFASPNRASIMSSVPSTERGIASGISSTLVNVGSTLSIGMAFIFMESVTPRSVLESIFSGTASHGSQMNISGFIMSAHVVFMASFLMLVLSILLYVFRTSHVAWDREQGIAQS